MLSSDATGAVRQCKYTASRQCLLCGLMLPVYSASTNAPPVHYTYTLMYTYTLIPATYPVLRQYPALNVVSPMEGHLAPLRAAVVDGVEQEHLPLRPQPP